MALKLNKIFSQSLLLFSISIYCLFMLPRMLSYGMFFDGVTYASVARNMAEGYGTFWKPYYSETIYNVFYEQPPLGLGLQSIAFRIFGDSTLLEQFWGFFAGLIVLWLIGLISLNVKKFRNDENRLSESNKQNFWFPIFLFVTIPMFSWLFSSNMLEIQMTVFVLLSSYTCILALTETKNIHSSIWASLSGVFILCAVLSKGPVGIFPFVIPFIAFFILKEISFKRTVLIATIMIISFILVLLLLLLTCKEAGYSLDQYINRQILASVLGEREKVESHFSILNIIAREIVVPLIMAILISVIFFIKDKGKLQLKFNRKFYFYFIIALCGSLPVLISSKQRGWYIFPSFPFYVLAISTLFEKYSERLQHNLLSHNFKYSKLILIISGLFFSVSVIVMFTEYNVLRKSKEFHHDFSIQKLNIKERETISVYPKELTQNWSLVADMQRSYKASLSDSLGHKYLLTYADSVNSTIVNSNYHLIHPVTPKKYVVFMKND